MSISSWNFFWKCCKEEETNKRKHPDCEETFNVKKIKLNIEKNNDDNLNNMPLPNLAQKIRGYSTIRLLAFMETESEETVGDRRMINIRNQLDNMFKNGKRIVRSYPQTVWHEAMLRSLIHLIYGSNVYANAKHRILRKYAMKKHHMLILITASRQVGKSTAVALFAAAIICFVPNIDIAIFANNKKRSQELMEQIHTLVLGIHGMASRIKTKNATTMVMSFNDLSEMLDTRKIECYTASNEVSAKT